MLHTIISKATVRSVSTNPEPEVRPAGPVLVPTREPRTSQLPARPALAELALIASRRCSAFFAEAAVLVLVFGILDLMLLKGRIDVDWIAGALALSIVLLGASIVTDFTAQRWIKAHP